MSTSVDPVALREEVKKKYLDVALHPDGEHHFHTGRPLARRLGYDPALIEDLPDEAIEAFAGVGNPFALRDLALGERVVDAGSGSGFDCFVAARRVGPRGKVVGIDMLAQMLERAWKATQALRLDNVEFRDGLLEDMPVETGWADAVISNGVINLCADKRAAFAEIWRVLRPGGRLHFADIANGRPVPEAARADIDLWTA
jgi:SAM-dependent methyltransferase